ncbi:cytochrome c oxidase assembly protein [Benzoatithermus flavus]|uniref:Cytochrome c oxidase assembly protein n=1 Tax=Benzoatithermus flavus TaxID=3108223 RepID=A0ABU8XVG7_9PROT
MSRRLAAGMLALLPVLLAATPAAAHEATARRGPDLWLLLAIGLPPALYTLGVTRLWRTAGIGRGARYGRVLCFALGWATCVIALASPLHALADRAFFAHMLVHLLLMTVTAPLLVLARPLAPLAWAFPGGARSWLLRPVLAAIRPLADPLVATGLQIAVLSVWHLPALFDLAVADRRVHTLQHLMLTASALLFWWSMLERCRGGQREGVAAFCLFLTMLHGTLLGALLTVAPHPWYGGVGMAAPVAGLAPLEDQQLGGLIMWVPGGLVYAAAALVLFAQWLHRAATAPVWMVMSHDEPTRG